MSRYAEGTQVSPEKSKLEIEGTLTRYGATGFISGWKDKTAFIMFEMQGRRMKFLLPLPDPKDKAFALLTKRSWREDAPQKLRQERYEQAVRQKWRALALAIKAKLEVVASGIATLEEEFMAHVVLPNGATVGEWMGPQIANAYRTAEMPPLLGSGRPT